MFQFLWLYLWVLDLNELQRFDNFAGYQDISCQWDVPLYVV